MMVLKLVGVIQCSLEAVEVAEKVALTHGMKQDVMIRLLLDSPAHGWKADQILAGVKKKAAGATGIVVTAQLLHQKDVSGIMIIIIAISQDAGT